MKADVLFLDSLSQNYTHCYFNSAYIMNYSSCSNFVYYANTFDTVPNKLEKLPNLLELLKYPHIVWLRSDDRFILIMILRRLIGKKNTLILHNDLTNSLGRRHFTLKIVKRFTEIIILKSILDPLSSAIEKFHPVLPRRYMPNVGFVSIGKDYGVFGRHNPFLMNQRLSSTDYYKSLLSAKIIVVNEKLIEGRASGIIAECQTYNKPILLINDVNNLNEILK